MYYLPHPDDPRKVLSYCPSKYCPEALVTDKDIVQGEDGELYFAGEEPAKLEQKEIAPEMRNYTMPDYNHPIIFKDRMVAPEDGLVMAWCYGEVMNFKVTFTPLNVSSFVVCAQHIARDLYSFDMPTCIMPVHKGDQMTYTKWHFANKATYSDGIMFWPYVH